MNGFLPPRIGAAGLELTKKSVCVWGLWLSTLVDLKLTMAHNQDRLQNSDSSVVYGHGHIIYSHTTRALELELQNGPTGLV